jgi:hypothetical protein
MILHSTKSSAERASDAHRGIKSEYMHHFKCACRPDAEWGLYPSSAESPRTPCPWCGVASAPAESWEQ